MSSTRKLIVAIVIGVVLAGPPVVALNIWLGGAVDRQASYELELSARRHMALAEARIGQAVSVLDELAAAGIQSCDASNVEALRRATFRTIPVKELSIVAADGRTLCTDVSDPVGLRKTNSSDPMLAGGKVRLEVLRSRGPARPVDQNPTSWRQSGERHCGVDPGQAVRSTGVDTRRAAELSVPDADRQRLAHCRNRP